MIAKSRLVVLYENVRFVGAFACYRPTGRRTEPGNHPARLIRFEGRFAAWAWEEPEGGCAYSGLSLVDARRGRDTLLESRSDCEPDPDGGFRVQRLVLRPGGAVAFP